MDAGKSTKPEPQLDFTLVVDIDNNHCWSRINVLTDALRAHAVSLQKIMVDNIREGDLDYAAVTFAEYSECNEMLYVIERQLIDLASENYLAAATNTKMHSKETIDQERKQARTTFHEHFKIP